MSHICPACRGEAGAPHMIRPVARASEFLRSSGSDRDQACPVASAPSPSPEILPRSFRPTGQSLDGAIAEVLTRDREWKAEQFGDGAIQ